MRILSRLSISLATACVMATSSANADTMSKSDFINFDPKQAALGQLLFYDKILSGNQNISCGTCHHHTLGGTDGVSLGIGEGGEGLGPNRNPGSGETKIASRIPRNAPALWNLGHRDVRVLFHDGRVEVTDAKGGRFETPAEARLPHGLNSILAAQALFPMSSDAEMAGIASENPVGAAFEERIDHGWEAVANRVRNTPEYEPHFAKAFPHVAAAQDITIVEIANALAAFIGTEWQSFDSPYDTYLTAGTPLPADAERGRQLFFGEAGCAQCHNGPLFSDQDFHSVGVPAFGPGRIDGQRDIGRMETTGDPDDAYKFRTPSLRNIALTGPYGHNGAFPTLRDMIRHMANPEGSLADWTPDMASLPKVAWLQDADFKVMSDQNEMQRLLANLDTTKVSLSDADISDIEAFLHTLTGASAEALPMGRPDTVPSGLPVD
ncbi:cytochrome c peroxidase [uncultured Pelagimonas sp.]|uniref:cytochrome-c peroxidase n=1 Tax=uncultured Pelagimonas sp. TaxID=1618102 RepID=UPI00260D9DE2|nr:cytochrome c peroxidase [uncultured Pelagimonas sp.]